MNPTIEQIKEQEERLQFSDFDGDTAYRLGQKIVAKAEEEGVSVTIDIRRGDHIVFHVAKQGTKPDNDAWVRRKSNVVQHFHCSSLRMGMTLARDGNTLAEPFGLDPADYAAHGGSFPITVRGVGVIGAITVSGLAQEDDHQMVVEAIESFLASQ